MKIFYACNTLREYVDSKRDVLRDFGVLRYCSRQELNELANATSEIHADRITRRLIECHMDDVDSEKKIDARDIAYNTEIGASTLSRKTKNAIMRNRIFTIRDFIDFVNQNGWIKLRGIGEFAAREVFSYIYPEKSEKEINEIVSKFKRVG